MDSRVWFTSDWHLWHKKIALYEPSRPPNFEELLFKNYFKTVSEDDVVFFLGDLAFGPKDNAKKAFRALPGRKILIRGNHDRTWTKKGLLACGFEQVHQTFLTVGDMVLSHYPVDNRDERWSQATHKIQNAMEKSSAIINVHGHMHSKASSSAACVNVSVERTNWTPVSEEWIRSRWVAKQSMSRRERSI